MPLLFSYMYLIILSIILSNLHWLFFYLNIIQTLLISYMKKETMNTTIFSYILSYILFYIAMMNLMNWNFTPSSPYLYFLLFTLVSWYPAIKLSSLHLHPFPTLYILTFSFTWIYFNFSLNFTPFPPHSLSHTLTFLPPSPVNIQNASW